MLELVDVGTRTLDSYRGIAPDHVLDKLAEAAEHLRGARVLHVNATPYGGGVSELLRSVVPLESDLGLVADWRIIRGDERFFQVTKAMHNGLQGADLELAEQQKSTYLASAEEKRARLRRAVRLRLYARSPTRGDAFHSRQGQRSLDLALSYRHLGTQPASVGIPAALLE